MTTETLDKLYLEWSQFTKARTASELVLDSIANSNPNHFNTPAEHANWCLETARSAATARFEDDS